MKLFDLRIKPNSRPTGSTMDNARGTLGIWPSFTGALLCFGMAAVACGVLALGDASPVQVQAGWKALMAEVGGKMRMPKNQLQADQRTLGAAVRYLLEPEPEFTVVRDRTYHGWEPLLMDTQAVTATAMLASNASRL